MPCSSKSVQERSPSVSSLIKGCGIQWNVERGWKKNCQIKNKKEKRLSEKTIFWWATGSSKTTDWHTARAKRALRKNDARDTRRTKKKWQGGTGKRPRVFYATWKGSK